MMSSKRRARARAWRELKSQDPLTPLLHPPDPEPVGILRYYENRCPDCGGPLAKGEGHIRCVICGYTRRIK